MKDTARRPGFVETGPRGRPARAVSLRIDHLSFDGLAWSNAEARQAGAAMERELCRLASTANWDRTGSAAERRVSAAAINVVPGASPARLGLAIARAVFAAVRGEG